MKNLVLTLLLFPALAQAGSLTKTSYPTAFAAAKAGAANAFSRATSTKTRASDVTGTLLKKTARTETFRMNDGDNNQVKQSVLKLKTGAWKAYHTASVTLGM